MIFRRLQKNPSRNSEQGDRQDAHIKKPSQAFEYHKGRLAFSQRQAYEDFLSAASSFRKDVPSSLPNAQLGVDAYNFLMLDHPELFSLSPEIRYLMTSGFPFLRQRGLSFQLSYLYSPNQARKIVESMEKAVDGLKGDRPLEFIDSLLELLTLECDYAIDNLANQNAASALYFHKAQCSGFSAAFKYACDRKGIPCIIIEGELLSGRRGPHAWNLVKIDGAFYHIDSTCIAYSNETKKLPLFKPFYLLSDGQMRQTHSWKASSYPACPKDYSPPKVPGSQDCFRFTDLGDLRSWVMTEYRMGRRKFKFEISCGQGYDDGAKQVNHSLGIVLKKLGIRQQVRLTWQGNRYEVTLP